MKFQLFSLDQDLIECKNLGLTYFSLTGLHNLCHAQNNGVYIPHPTDCSKFVQCDKFCAVVKICADGTAFDDSLGNCNHEYLVNCSKISKKAITDFSNLARTKTITNTIRIDETYRKFSGAVPKNPKPI